MSTFGTAISVNLFGESHGEAIGIVINNLPPGILIDMDNINNELYKRRPKSTLSTPRREQDEFKVLSGLFKGKTTGSPLTFIIPNTDTRSKDYTPNILRPSHADFTAFEKYEGNQDYRGSGHFSGRITAPLMILGAISRQLLARKGIVIASHIASIKDKKDNTFTSFSPTLELAERLNSSDFPLIDETKKAIFENIILSAKEEKDSVGGTVETCILGISPGLGFPFFDSIESVLSHAIFSVPAVKGISFGRGFEISTLKGSEANDSFILENGQIKTKTNNSGGIQGGISNGMPITFTVAIKPTASIGKPQKTVDFATKEEVILELQGRHDPSIVHRVIHVINAITAFTIVDLITRKEGYSCWK